MTVKELIKTLRTFPQDRFVYIDAGSELGFCSLESVDHQKMGIVSTQGNIPSGVSVVVLRDY